MLGVLSDIHAYAQQMLWSAQRARANGACILIQVGDFGVWGKDLPYLIKAAKQSPIPIYFIDGNHEDFGIIDEWIAQMDEEGSSVYHLLKDKLIYVRRGSILQLDGRTIAFLGGAASIDKAGERHFQQRAYDDYGELVKPADVARLKAAFNALPEKKVDLMFTHTLPRLFADKFFNNNLLRNLQKHERYGVPYDWRDSSELLIEEAWRYIGEPILYCGHWHERASDFQIRVLTEHELTYA